MYFTGIEARNHESTIKGLLKNYLQDSLNAEPYLSQFSQYGGVDVVYRDDEVTDAETVGRPFLGLVKGGVKTERWGKTVNGNYCPGTRYLWSFDVMAVATDFSGGQTGIENPIASDTQLCDALVYLVDSPDGYQSLNDLGFEEAVLIAQQERTDGTITRSNPFTLTFTTHTIPSL